MFISVLYILNKLKWVNIGQKLENEHKIAIKQGKKSPKGPRIGENSSNRYLQT